MEIRPNIAFTFEEFAKVLVKRGAYSDKDIEEVASFIVKDSPEMIESMGYDSKNVKIDFIRNKGVPAWGSGRIPLHVKSEMGDFILKPYDTHNPKEERKILEYLKQAKAEIAPQTYFVGDKGYAEEFLKGKPLTQIVCEEGIESAIKYGGEMHAKLAKLGISYNHNHWLDEFYIDAKGQKVLDFGTAQFFLKEGASPEFDARLDKLTHSGVGSVLKHDHNNNDYWVDGSLYGIPFRLGIHIGEPALEKALSIGKTPEERLNLLTAWYTAGLGIAKHFLCTTHQFCSELAVKSTMEVMPVFLESFAKAYK